MTRSWSPLRVCALAALLFSCNDRSIATPSPRTTGSAQHFFQTFTDKLDVLFVIDDSTSMTPVQDNLVRNFPRFIEALRILPGGELPSVHIGVTTTNMGAGVFTAQTSGCSQPDMGRFVAEVRAATSPTCATSRLQGGMRFIESDHGRVNFTGTLEEVFGCIAQVGAQKCGFEQSFSAAEAALGPAAPPENQGFLRDDAALAIIFITNEDDCSAPLDTQLFDPNGEGTLGPTQPRCARYGTLCDGQMPPLEAGALARCISNDQRVESDPGHALFPVPHFIDRFRRLKSDPDRVIVAAVAAPNEPFAMGRDQGGNIDILPSCSLNDADHTYGKPAVRVKALIDAFGPNGTIASICQESYAEALRGIAATINPQFVPCVHGQIAKAPSFGEALEPLPRARIDSGVVDCRVERVRYQGGRQTESLGAIPPCDAQIGDPCWVLVGDEACAPYSGAKLLVCRNGYDPNAVDPCVAGLAVPEAGETIAVQCATVPGAN